MGFIRDEDQTRDLTSNTAKLDFKINHNDITDAPCKIQEIVNQINSNIPTDLHITVFAVKARLIIYDCIIPPLFEEIIYRGLIQDCLLTRCPKYLIKRIAPGKEAIIDTTIAKIIRITFTAAIFYALHL